MFGTARAGFLFLPIEFQRLLEEIEIKGFTEQPNRKSKQSWSFDSFVLLNTEWETKKDNYSGEAVLPVVIYSQQ